MSSPSGSSQTPKTPPDQATLKRAIKSLDKALTKSPDDIRCMVRMARAHRLLGDNDTSADWYRKSIDLLSEQRNGLRALALAKELLCVAPNDHTVLLEMARLYARHPIGENSPGRIATPLGASSADLDFEEQSHSVVQRSFTQVSARAIAFLDDAAAVEGIEPSAIFKGEGAQDSTVKTPPPPPPEAFLVAEEDEVTSVSGLSEDPAWSKELAALSRHNKEIEEARQKKKDPESTTKGHKTGRSKMPPPPPTSGRIDPDEVSESFLQAFSSSAPPEYELARIPTGKRILKQARIGDVPFLSTLGEKAFVTISKAMRPVSLRSGDILFRKGDDARSFFIVAQGELEATIDLDGQRHSLAVLGEGEVVGLFGLYTGRKRSATVVALGSAVVFEITDQILAHLVKEHPQAKKPLALFYRRRLLEVSLGKSPIFQDLTREKRLAIVDRFEQRRMAPKEIVISPGHVTLGLYLVMRGEVIITTRDGGKITVKARMGRGQFFGCISALTGMPTIASAECSQDTVLAILAHKTFSELLKLQPELKQLPAQLKDQGVLITPTLFVGDLKAVCSTEK